MPVSGDVPLATMLPARRACCNSDHAASGWQIASSPANPDTSLSASPPVSALSGCKVQLFLPSSIAPSLPASGDSTHLLRLVRCWFQTARTSFGLRVTIQAAAMNRVQWRSPSGSKPGGNWTANGLHPASMASHSACCGEISPRFARCKMSFRAIAPLSSLVDIFRFPIVSLWATALGVCRIEQDMALLPLIVLCNQRMRDADDGEFAEWHADARDRRRTSFRPDQAVAAPGRFSPNAEPRQCLGRAPAWRRSFIIHGEP